MGQFVLDSESAAYHRDSVALHQYPAAPLLRWWLQLKELILEAYNLIDTGAALFFNTEDSRQVQTFGRTMIVSLCPWSYRKPVTECLIVATVE